MKAVHTTPVHPTAVHLFICITDTAMACLAPTTERTEATERQQHTVATVVAALSGAVVYGPYPSSPTYTVWAQLGVSFLAPLLPTSTITSGIAVSSTGHGVSPSVTTTIR